MNSDTKSPIVTIIMPVYNGEKYLRESIESILGQTFSNFIFLIIDDGSTDTSIDIVKSYADSRIKLMVNENNLGISKTLNLGIEDSKTTYIARMDQDDISLPNRIETQVHFMENHPGVGVCGTWMMAFSEKNKSTLKKRPIKNDDIQVGLLFHNPMAHPTVMIRKEVLDTYNLKYDPEYDGLEDYDMWERMSHVTKMENIPKALLLYRHHSTQLSRTSPSRQEKLDKIQNRQYRRIGVNRGDSSSLLTANKSKRLYNKWSLRRIVYGLYYANLKSFIKKFTEQ